MMYVQKALNLNYKQDMHWRLLAPFHQAVLNFMGKSPQSSRLVGGIIDEETCRREWSADRIAIPYVDINAMMAAYFFTIMNALMTRG
jgi:hypothetical protein